ncbi:hypothetical protein PR003_g14514 [Phytophthora rubi]|uniref:Uncharacterized protein n=1 Tax=Phytophthora rubi TaxID=129364 RepID=A0A6A4FDS8_9STRA|nr:hypothetical protein PR003_g14514 [Phytophthora rubi]
MATAKCVVVLGANGCVKGVNTLQAERIQAIRLDLEGVISNLNVGSVIIKSYSSANLAGRLVDIHLIDMRRFFSFSPAGLTDGGRVSSQIFLNAKQWVPIYIQYQCNVGSSPYFSFEYSFVSSPPPPPRCASAYLRGRRR